MPDTVILLSDALPSALFKVVSLKRAAPVRGRPTTLLVECRVVNDDKRFDDLEIGTGIGSSSNRLGGELGQLPDDELRSMLVMLGVPSKQLKTRQSLEREALALGLGG
jgi:hypothetical protein